MSKHKITPEKLEYLERGTKVSFNCPYCKEYWQERLEYWKDLGNAIEDIHLYCPMCSPYRRERTW